MFVRSYSIPVGKVLTMLRTPETNVELVEGAVIFLIDSGKLFVVALGMHGLLLVLSTRSTLNGFRARPIHPQIILRRPRIVGSSRVPLVPQKAPSARYALSTLQNQ